MRKAATAKQRMAKQNGRKRRMRPLILKLKGPGVRPGRVAVPDLLILCQQAQSAVERQAEAIEGKRTLRPGPTSEKVRIECTLELASLRPGSSILGFELAKPQQPLPTFTAFGEEAIAHVARAIESIARGQLEGVDPGVLDSLNNMGQMLNGRVRTIEWIARRSTAPKGTQKRVVAVFDQKVRRAVASCLQRPSERTVSITGVLEMADFKANDLKCRILQPIGPPVPCSFDPGFADKVYGVLRKAAQVTGTGTLNAQSGRIENLHISTLTPVDPLAVGAEYFFGGRSIDELARLQGVEPIEDVAELAGGWPDDDDVDAAMEAIYRHREQDAQR